VFDKNFVNFNIRLFFSERFSKLAYVTPMNQTYKTQRLFTNLYRHNDDVGLINFVSETYTMSYYPHLIGASCIISNNFIKSMNYQFPNSVADDIYTENIAARTGWTSLMTDLTVCLQMYDSDFKANVKRSMRIFDWIIKLNKTKPFHNFNEKYSN
jgi:hypothetical protein